MALSFPAALAWLSGLIDQKSTTFDLMKFEEMSGYGDGEWLTAKTMPDLWEASCRTIVMPYADAQRVRARLNRIGSSETFLLSNPRQPWPVSDPDGALYGSSTPSVASVNVSRRGLALSGLPAGYVLKEGDLFQIDHDSASRVALVELAEDVTADGSGDTAEFEVSPVLRPSIAADDAVSFASPAAKMKVVPGSLKMVPDGIVRASIAFVARQTLKAD